MTALESPTFAMKQYFFAMITQITPVVPSLTLLKDNILLVFFIATCTNLVPNFNNYLCGLELSKNVFTCSIPNIFINWLDITLATNFDESEPPCPSNTPKKSTKFFFPMFPHIAIASSIVGLNVPILKIRMQLV